uniref:Uncharacterized protein n=1 Tax=Aegilops tauschii subsp. strangulata TaxID=200361 RepID=A0A453SWQ6_AEGTS
VRLYIPASEAALAFLPSPLPFSPGAPPLPHPPDSRLSAREAEAKPQGEPDLRSPLPPQPSSLLRLLGLRVASPVAWPARRFSGCLACASLLRSPY